MVHEPSEKYRQAYPPGMPWRAQVDAFQAAMNDVQPEFQVFFARPSSSIFLTIFSFLESPLSHAID